MYRGNGALFSTMETVAGEKPLRLATSFMVTASVLREERFTILFVAASSGNFTFDCNGGLFKVRYSAGASNDMTLRNPDVFQAPQMSPRVTQMAPSCFAGRLSCHQMYAQIV